VSADLAREWPAHGLDVQGLAASGWRPVPFQQFILKVHGRCNLACDYCYVYEAADQSWKSRPTVMSEGTIRQTAWRVARHVERNGLGEIEIVLHGGEPLLAGTKLIDLAVREFRTTVPDGCRVDVTMQTNGLLLTDRTLDLLAAHEVGVSVSLDGDQEGHDRHRRYVHGGGSHAGVIRGLTLLAERYRALYRGLLCVVDLANDPHATYRALLETGPPRMDLLLPHGNWSARPPDHPAVDDGRTPYADWLIAIFDRWYGAPVRETGIRIFEEIMNMVLGGQSHSESVGLSPVAMVVIDTDGSLQQVDTLKTSYAGGPQTGLNVADHDFGEALWHPGVVARQIGPAALSTTCSGCRIRDICGGGAYTHRYRAGDGYRNPSVYCPDLQKLIDHIAGTVRDDVMRPLVREGVHNGVGSM
jgi:uncharacterized protein